MNELIKNDYVAVDQLVAQGYVSVDEVMALDGYTYSDEASAYEKTIGGVSISVSLDLENLVVHKNEYTFEIENYITQNDNVYLLKDNMEAVLGKQISYSDEVLTLSGFDTAWTDYRMIAHAAGTVRESTYNSNYTNSKEGLVSNYDLGYRVFEVDFCLTSDERLACVHDWWSFGNFNGEAMSYEEWIQSPASAMPMTASRFTTMVVEDVLDAMIVNPDMYLVTDTKAHEVSEEEARLAIELIYEAAMERDPALLERIIPQIYNIGMYEMVESIYHFPNMIFTIYGTDETIHSITEFINSTDNIQVLTAPVESIGVRVTNSIINSLHEHGKLVYVHPINTYPEVTKYAALGIDGFYTRLFLPYEMDVYESITECYIPEEVPVE